MARTGRQHYPPATDERWYEDDFGGSAMESNVVVWHTTEGTSLPSYGGGSSAPNFTALPDFGARRLRWYQHFRFDTSSRALVNRAGGVETNTLNCVQVEKVGTCDPRHKSSWSGRRANRDYVYWPEAPSWALADLARFARWCYDEHGVQMRSPVQWLAYPGSYGNSSARLSAAEWRGTYGHVGHQHVPENSHGDPGDLDIPWVLDMAKNRSWDGDRDMELTDTVKLSQWAEERWHDLRDGEIRVNTALGSGYAHARRGADAAESAHNAAAAAVIEVRELRKQVERIAVGGVDLDALAAKVADLLATRLAE